MGHFEILKSRRSSTYLASAYLYGATVYTLLEIVPSLNIVFEVSNQLWGGGGGVLEAQRLTSTHSIRSDYAFYQMGIIHLLKTFLDSDQFKIRLIFLLKKNLYLPLRRWIHEWGGGGGV